jgi:hypothetical protein
MAYSGPVRGAAYVGASMFGKMLGLADTPAQHLLQANKMGTLGLMQQFLKKTAQFVEGTSSKFDALGSKTNAARLGVTSSFIQDFSGTKERKKAAANTIIQLENLMAKPDELADHISSIVAPLEQFAPETAAQLAVGLGKVLQTARELSVKRTDKVSPQPSLERSNYITSKEVAKLERTLHAIQDPFYEIDSLLKGIPNNEALQVLENHYGTIWNKVKTTLAEHVANSPTLLTQKQRRVYSYIMGAQADSRMDTPYIKRAQDVYKNQEPKQSSPGVQPPSSITFDKNFIPGGTPNA